MTEQPFKTRIKSFTTSNPDAPWAKVILDRWVVENGQEVNAWFSLTGEKDNMTRVTYTRRGTNTGFKLPQ